MDGAGASGPYPAVAGSRRGARGTGARGAGPGGAAAGADLGGSSKYSNENFEGRSGWVIEDPAVMHVRECFAYVLL